MAKTTSANLPISMRPLLLGAAIFFGALTAAAGFLWFWFGSKVFFDMVAAGIAYCF